MHMDGIWLIEFILKRVELLPSKSSVQSTAAGHVDQNRSVAAIWELYEASLRVIQRFKQRLLLWFE